MQLEPHTKNPPQGSETGHRGNQYRQQRQEPDRSQRSHP
jgi:hypothetical protein